MTGPVEVVVVGGGLAGWVAAVRAQESGKETLLLEGSAQAPGWGNTLISGGALHAVLQDPRTPPNELVAKITQLTGGHADQAVALAWARNAARTITWMKAHGADLMSDPQQPHRACVLSPVRPTVPGVASSGFGAELFLTHLAGLFTRRGGAIRYSTRAVDLRPEAEGWTLLIEEDSGKQGRVTASRVILCDGGFQASPDLLRRYVGTDKVRLRATDTGQGDGLKMGLSVGGVPVNMEGFYGHVLVREALRNDALWPYPILDGLAAAGIAVGPSGRRFVDESVGGVCTANHIAWSPHPLDSWIVVDHDAWEGAGRVGVTPPNPHLLEHGGTVLTGWTLTEVAEQAGIDAGGLADSVQEVCASSRTSGVERRGPVRVDVPPFHAIPVVAGVTFTLGGLRVDGDARVLGADGLPVRGLYAAGGTMGGLHGGPQAGYAGGLLEAAIFGLLAGTDAAGSPL